MIRSMCKQFIFLRFGMNNFTMDWFEWRLKWFECVALTSLENNANDAMYVVIFINRNIPVEAKRRLNELLESSAIRPYFYILELDFPNEVKPMSLDFVKSHCAQDERVMITRLDMDDGYAAGFLQEIDQRDLQEDQKQTVLYSFSPGYRFAIEEKKAIEWDIHYRGLNMFLFTRDRNATIWEFSHFKGREYSEEKGWKVVEDYSLDRRWYRSETPDNTDVTVWENKYRDLVESIKRKDCPVIELSDIISRFSLNPDKVEAFYSEYPTIPYTHSILIYDSLLTKKCSLLKRDLNRLIDVYCESIPRNISEKPKTKWNIKRVQDENNCNFLHAVESIYGLEKLRESRAYERCSSLETISRVATWEDMIVVIAAKGTEGAELFDIVVDSLQFGTKKKSLFSREFTPAGTVVENPEAKGGMVAIWDGVTTHIKKSEQRLYIEYIVDIAEEKLTRIRATSSCQKGAPTAQIFIGDSNKHTWTSEVDYALNEVGVNVVIASRKNPGRVIDSFLVKQEGGSLVIHRSLH